MSDEFEARFAKVIKKLDELGAKKAEARAISWQLQEMRKVILASEMQKFDGSLSERESRARTSAAYITHIEGTKVAIEREHLYHAEWEAQWARYEALRSLCSQATAQQKTGNI